MIYCLVGNVRYGKVLLQHWSMQWTISHKSWDSGSRHRLHNCYKILQLMGNSKLDTLSVNFGFIKILTLWPHRNVSVLLHCSFTVMRKQFVSLKSRVYLQSVKTKSSGSVPNLLCFLKENACTNAITDLISKILFQSIDRQEK